MFSRDATLRPNKVKAPHRRPNHTRRRDIDDVAGTRPKHPGCCLLREVEEPPKIDRDHRREIGFGIVNELLGDENTGVIYQRVDSSETLNVDDALGGIATGDVAIYDQDSRITGGIDRARVGDDALANLAKAFDQAGADATRSTGNNDNLLFEGHDSSC